MLWDWCTVCNSAMAVISSFPFSGLYSLCWFTQVTPCLPVSFPKKKKGAGMGGVEGGCSLNLASESEGLMTTEGLLTEFTGFGLQWPFSPDERPFYLSYQIGNRKLFQGPRSWEVLSAIGRHGSSRELKEHFRKERKGLKPLHHLTMLRHLWIYALVAKLLLASLVFLLPFKIFTGWL